MKTKILSTLILAVIGQVAFANTIKTTSAKPNLAFPKTAEQIVVFDKNAVSVLQLTDPNQSGEVGKLISFECAADTDKVPAAINCVFKHDLPDDWDYYGFLNIHYSFEGGNEGASTFAQKWSQN